MPNRNRPTLNVTLNPKVIEKLKACADDDMRTVSNMIEVILMEKLGLTNSDIFAEEQESDNDTD